MNTQELIEELRLQMKQVQEQSQKIKLNAKNTRNLVCVESNGETFFNPHYISIEEYHQIIELEKFLLRHSDLNDRDLRFIFSGNVFYFSFLEQLRKTIPGLSETIRAFGANVVAGMFVGTRLEYTSTYEL